MRTMMSSSATVSGSVTTVNGERGRTHRGRVVCGARRVVMRSSGGGEDETEDKGKGSIFTAVEKIVENVGVGLGPIGMTLQQGETKNADAASQGRVQDEEAFE